MKIADIANVTSIKCHGWKNSYRLRVILVVTLSRIKLPPLHKAKHLDERIKIMQWWSNYIKGRGMPPNSLSKQLKEFDIVSNTIRIGLNNPAKGYIKDQFNDAFKRYLSSSPIDTPYLSVTTLHNKRHSKSSQNNKRYNNANVTDEKTLKSFSTNDCNVVTDKVPLAAGGDSEIVTNDDDEGVYFDLD